MIFLPSALAVTGAQVKSCIYCRHLFLLRTDLCSPSKILSLGGNALQVPPLPAIVASTVSCVANHTAYPPTHDAGQAQCKARAVRNTLQVTSVGLGRFSPHPWPSVGADCCAQDALKSWQNLSCLEGTGFHPSCSARPGIGAGRGVSLLPPLWDLMGQCGRQGWKLNFQMTTSERQVRKGYPLSSPALSDEKP